MPRPFLTAILKYFEYSHLPEKQATISRAFHVLANEMTNVLPGSPEVTVCLRKLLEAKDCAVRASLDVPYKPATED